MGASNIVAYYERESFDPETGAPGILRQEWRVRLVEDFAPEDLVNAFGSDWRNYRPFASHILEHRYIRRGAVEPWTPFQAANSWDQAVEYVDDHATPVAPRLVKLFDARRAGREATYKKEQEEREQRWEAETRQRQRDRSEAAFTKLASGKDKAWADKWNAWVAAHQSERAKDAAAGDPEFMALYHAVMDADTVPTKRRAIKDFLTYVEGRAEFGRFRGFDGLDLEDDMRARKFCVTARSPREAAKKLEGLGADDGDANLRAVDVFTLGYIDAALWSSTDESGEPLDKGHYRGDIAPECLRKMKADCKKFQHENAEDLAKATDRPGYNKPKAGHDFWLTRNGHGVGFWDRDLGAVGGRLTEAAHKYGEVYLYVGDDGLIYCD